MKNTSLLVLGIVLALGLAVGSCSKKKVRKSQLDGEVYSVEGVYLFQGVDYATWKNTHEGGLDEGGLDVSNVDGTWDFSDPNAVSIRMSYDWIDGAGNQWEGGWQDTGYVDMLSNSGLSFNITSDDGGWTISNWYQVHENKGKNLTLVYIDESDLGGGANAFCGFVHLKR